MFWTYFWTHFYLNLNYAENHINYYKTHNYMKLYEEAIRLYENGFCVITCKLNQIDGKKRFIPPKGHQKLLYDDCKKHMDKFISFLEQTDEYKKKVAEHLYNHFMRRDISKRDFNIMPDSTEKKEFKKLSAPRHVQFMVDEMYKYINKEKFISKEQLYIRYKLYSQTMNYKNIPTERQFISYFKREFAEIKYIKKMINKKRAYGFEFNKNNKIFVDKILRNYGFIEEDMNTSEVKDDTHIITIDNDFIISDE